MKYDVIYKKLKEQIYSTDSSYNIGNKLPTEQQLSSDFNVSRSTIRKVICQLNKEGIIECYQGKGHFIRQKRDNSAYIFSKTLNTPNNQEKIDIIAYKIITVPVSIAQNLDLSINDKVYFINRLIIQEDLPVKIQDIFLPCKLFPTLSYDDMLHPINNILKKYQSQNQIMGRLRFIPSLADTCQAKLLNVDKDKLLQQMIAVITSGNIALVYMITTYCPEKNNPSFLCIEGEN